MHDTLSELGYTVCATISGIFSAILGYFLPVRDIVHIVFIFFVLDMLVGYWAARKLRGEKFSTPRVWATTVPRLLLSIVVILAAFGWDKVFEQNLISTYKLIGWFISGILLYSIILNGYKITSWHVFPRLAKVIKDKLGLNDEDNEEF